MQDGEGRGEKKTLDINNVYKQAIEEKKWGEIKPENLCAIIDMGNNKYEFYLGNRKAEVLRPEKIKKLLESIDKNYLFKGKLGDWNVYVFPQSELEKYLEKMEKVPEEVKEVAKEMRKTYGPEIKEQRKKKYEILKVPSITRTIYEPIVNCVKNVYNTLKNSVGSVLSAIKNALLFYRK